MSNFIEIIKKKTFKSDNLMFNLIQLFQELKNNNFQKQDLETTFTSILSKFEKDIKDDGVELSYECYLAEQVNYAFVAVYTEIEEIPDEKIEIKIVSEITDGDIIPYDCSEPEVDLSSLANEETHLDLEYMKLMGYKDE